MVSIYIAYLTHKLLIYSSSELFCSIPAHKLFSLHFHNNEKIFLAVLHNFYHSRVKISISILNCISHSLSNFSSEMNYNFE